MEETNEAKSKMINDMTMLVTGEDHTLLNVLKWAVSNNWKGEKIEFCGYNIPHPSEDIAQFTIQFEDENIQNQDSVINKVCEGLEIIELLCKDISFKFDACLNQQ